MTTTTTTSVDAGDVLVVVARPARSAWLEAVLDDTERDRAARLGCDDDRRRFVTGHALTRLVLAEATGLPATALTFHAQCPRCGGRHGKPRLAAAPEVHFSATRAADRVAVAVTRLGPVGVDLEPARAAGFPGFADVALTANERTAFERMPLEQRAGAATIWWVRKEAVLKARGDGMYMSPDELEITGPAEVPRLIAWNGDEKPTVPMHLVDLGLGPDYVGCLAVLTDRVPRFRLTDGTDLLAAGAGQPRRAIR